MFWGKYPRTLLPFLLVMLFNYTMFVIPQYPLMFMRECLKILNFLNIYIQDAHGPMEFKYDSRRKIL